MLYVLFSDRLSDPLLDSLLDSLLDQLLDLLFALSVWFSHRKPFYCQYLALSIQKPCSYALYVGICWLLDDCPGKFF